jgi:hypothetical protein
MPDSIRRKVEDVDTILIFARGLTTNDANTLKSQLKEPEPSLAVINTILLKYFEHFEVRDSEGELIRRLKPRLLKILKRSNGEHFLKFAVKTKPKDYVFRTDPLRDAIFELLKLITGGTSGGDPEEGTLTVTLAGGSTVPAPIDIPVIIED